MIASLRGNIFLDVLCPLFQIISIFNSPFYYLLDIFLLCRTILSTGTLFCTDSIFSEERIFMDAISYTAARANLSKTMEKVCDDHAPVIITRKSESPVVMVSLEDYQAMEETAYLLRSPANAQRLLASIAELESGQGIEHSLSKD